MMSHSRSMRFRFGALVGCAPATQRLFEQLARIAATQSAVLVEGETGTGKRLVAQEIVRHSGRAAQPVVMLDCDDTPSEVELALFGNDPGVSDQPSEGGGALAVARGGTLVLKEVAALPLTAQARLVRLIETGFVQRIGAQRTRRIDVRVIAITREDLAKRCEQRLFRSDLYFCLRALRVRVPPLRERFEDLPLLVEALAAEERCPSTLHLDEDFVEWLRCRAWTGNMRELRNVLERVRALGLATVMAEPDHSPPANVTALFAGAHMAHAEHAWVVQLLRRHHGNVAQAASAARRSSSWLRRRIRHHNIDLSEFRAPVASLTADTVAG
ncbi:MAG: Response regulator of zinc sigma-54-dependent two-component system [Myxococcales bacterium]|nr:Response regulator of zinc sigma-54-dependent two-component system [Myxococcales bacterium]